MTTSVTRIVDRTSGRHVVDVEDADDPAVPYMDGAGTDSAGRHDPAASHDEIGEVGHSPTRFNSIFS